MTSEVPFSIICHRRPAIRQATNSSIDIAERDRGHRDKSAPAITPEVAPREL